MQKFIIPKEKTKALAHFIEAIQVRDSIGDLHGLASTLNNMGNLYVDEKKYSEAEVNFNRSNAIAEKENLIGIQQRNYAGLARLHELAGDNVRALAFYKQYSTLRDTVFNQDLKQQIADVKVQYETEKSRRENQLLRQQLQQQKEIQQLRSSNSKKSGFS